MLRVLNSVWVGDRLGPLERLSILSGLVAGHPFHIYSYEPDKLEGVPPGAEVRDAAEVMTRERMTAYAECGSFVLGSNFWRYEMLRQGRGYWVDLDLLLLKPLDFDEDYVFGREQEGRINTAVLLAPADSALVRDLVDFPKTMRRPPWFGAVRSAKYHLKSLLKGGSSVEDLPWGTFGPQMLSYFVAQHGLEKFASDPSAFYPLSWRNARALYGPSEQVEALLSEETYAIHFYNSQLRDLAKIAPPQGSFMAKQFEKFGISFDELAPATPRKMIAKTAVREMSAAEFPFGSFAAGPS